MQGDLVLSIETGSLILSRKPRYLDLSRLPLLYFVDNTELMPGMTLMLVDTM